MFRLPWHSSRRAIQKIFISYRRQDAEDAAGRLASHLSREFGDHNVFLDVVKIGSGDNFAQVIDKHVAASDVLLALIGKTWASCADDRGQRRLDAPDDFVRHEIASALRQRVWTIPILLNGAPMPKREELPQDIGDLVMCNAHPLRHATYDDDFGSLIQQLRGGTKSLWKTIRRMLLGRAARASALAVGSLMFMFAWVSLFDYWGWETRIASYSMWLGEKFAPVSLSPELAIVAIDEETERALNKPFGSSWRADHARLLDQLAKAGVKSVAFDLEFNGQTEFDQALIDAAAQARRSGTAVTFGLKSRLETGDIERAASGLGVLCIGNRLGYATIAPLAVKNADHTLGALALHAVYRPRKIGPIDQEGHKLVLDSEEKTQLLNFSVLENVDAAQPKCGVIKAGDIVAEMIVKLSPINDLRNANLRHRYEDVIVEPAAQRLKDKIVLIGVQKKGIDQVLVRGNEERFGVELHADAINNLISKIHVRPLGESAQFLLMAAMAAVGAWLRYWRPELPYRVRLTLLLAAAALYVVTTLLVYREFHVLLNSAYNLGALLLAYWVVGRLVKRWA